MMEMIARLVLKMLSLKEVLEKAITNNKEFIDIFDDTFDCDLFVIKKILPGIEINEEFSFMMKDRFYIKFKK